MVMKPPPSDKWERRGVRIAGKPDPKRRKQGPERRLLGMKQGDLSKQLHQGNQYSTQICCCVKMSDSAEFLGKPLFLF